MSSPKRRRIAPATAASASADDDQQRQHVQEAKHLLSAAASHDTALARSKRLIDLAQGRAESHQLAWSCHNLIAYASSLSASLPTARPHVVLRSLAQTSSSDAATASGLRPCRLYPPADPDVQQQQRLFASVRADPTTSMPYASPTAYADPECITFSPCGFYITAYFPLADTQPAGGTLGGDAVYLLNQQEQALQQIEQASGGMAAAPPSIPSLSRNPTGGIGGGDPMGMASTLGVGLLPSAPLLSALPPTRTGGLAGKLCIWSRAETGALNDWRPIQMLDVVEGDDTPKHATEPKADDAGQPQLDADASGLADRARSAPAGAQLENGVKRIVWLGGKRKWVVDGSSGSGSDSSAKGPTYRREASRGPSFLNAEETAGPQPDLALVVFGKRGQVTLLYRREVDRQARARASQTRMHMHPQQPPFEVVQSSLFTPALHPAPPTISSNVTGFPTPQSEQAGTDGVTSHVPSGLHMRPPLLSHLAVGLLADEPILVVACKQAGWKESSIQLCEVTIDLKADSVSMVTRPLSRLPLISTWTSNEGTVDPTEAGLGGEAVLTSLSWVEVERKAATGGTTSPSASSLRLAATFDARSAATSADAATVVKVWDLLQDDDELSEAFGQLECRKTSQPPKTVERSLRQAFVKRFEGETFTSMLMSSSQLTTSAANVVAASVLTALRPDDSSERDATTSRQSESLRYLDASTFDSLPSLSPAEPSSSAIPTKAADRDSALVLSPNGVLAAALARDPSGGVKKRLVIWKVAGLGTGPADVPTAQPTTTEEEAEAARAGHLLGLAMLRRSDPLDVARALFSGRKREFVGSALLQTAEGLGMTHRGSSGADVSTEAGRSKTMPSFLHILRLLEVQLSLVSVPFSSPSDATVKSDHDETPPVATATATLGDSERLILSLSKLHELLRSSRILTSSTSGSTRIHYRLSSIWPLIAHLQWTLSTLDTLVLHAYPSIRITPLVELLTYRTPRQLFASILRGLCEFKAWLLSTVHQENLPPLVEEDEAKSGDTGWNVGVMAISEQCELARDAARHVVVEGSVGMERALKVFSSLPSPSDGEERWYLPNAPHTRLSSAETLLKALVDEESGALVDPLTLFLRPGDLVDEKTALRPEERGGEFRDVMTKRTMREGERMKRCVRCKEWSIVEQGTREGGVNGCLCGGEWWIV